MVGKVNMSFVVCFFVSLEMLTIFYYEHERLVEFYKIAGRPSLVNISDDRIKKDMNDEVDSIYGSHGNLNKLSQEEKDRLSKEHLMEIAYNRFQERNKHMSETCKKYDEELKLNKRRRTDQFLINNKYGLAYCNIFKAASSSWLWNFNILAGFSEKQLLPKLMTPLYFARKRYPRPSPTQLDSFRRTNPNPITFIIVRHPFTRLVSGFRDKILKGTTYYRPMGVTMMKRHPELQEQHPADWHQHLKIKHQPMPTFAQFVQYILDEKKNRKVLNEHWVTMTEYCTPCTNHFDVIAKVETLAEDGNYIIYKSGIEDVIKPRVVNKAEGDSSDDLTDYYVCQLTESQLKGISELYKNDLRLFGYNTTRYFDCVSKYKGVPGNLKTLDFFKNR